LELRAAMGAVINWVNGYDAGIAGLIPLEWLPIGTRRPRAAVMNQLMNLILGL
jgi:hypothetical protein